MQTQIKNIIQDSESLRQNIVNHPVYSEISDVYDLQVFMKYHIYAVWDFMSLLKGLQQQLTCTTIPWYPIGDAETRHLINEIVSGEESDVDEFGKRKSHFELYLDAMEQCGADISEILRFLAALNETNDLEKSFEYAGTPEAARKFVRFTFEVINTNKPHILSSVFTFGREDLIPHMFVSIIDDIYSRLPETISTFKYYLERHVEVDGDVHSHLSLQMTSNLCQQDDQKWKEANEYTLKALQMRCELWNGVYEELKANVIA